MAFKNRIRLPFYLSQPQFPVERNVFRNAIGETTLLTAIVRNTYQGKTDQLPEDWHRKLVIALVHKEVTVEDNRLLTDVVIDGDYDIDWQDFLNYPIAASKFTIQVTPFNASSNNCQSCSQITQLNLVDDHTDDIFDEGQTYEYPDIITANDSICCFPFTIELISFNTTYFENVSIDADGVVTFTVKDPVPVINDVLLLTYRVTCSDGSYDEANVFANISGSSTVCVPPTNLILFADFGTFAEAEIDWTYSPPALDGYNWWLYDCDDVYTIVQSGHVTTEYVELTGLHALHCYVFVVQADCGGEVSTVATLQFTTASPRPADTCGKWIFYYVPEDVDAIQSISYMDCDGNTQTYFFSYSHAIERCLLQSAPGVPIYVVASTPEISISYLEPC